MSVRSPDIRYNPPTSPAASPAASPQPSLEEQRLLEGLRRGDEAAFTALVQRYHAPLLHLAASFVPNRAVAEEVVQDTWQGVLQGLHRFQGRAPFRTWLYRILLNCARTRGRRERARRPSPPSARGPTP